MLGAPHFAMEMMPKSQKITRKDDWEEKKWRLQERWSQVAESWCDETKGKNKKERHKKAIFMPHPHKNEIARKNRRTISKK